MSYTPTEWKTGDVITAEKLNHIEDGIMSAGSVYLAEMVMDESGERPEFLDTNFSVIKTAVEYRSLIIFWVKAVIGNTTAFNYFPPDNIVLNDNGGGNIDVAGNIFVAANDQNNPSYVDGGE